MKYALNKQVAAVGVSWIVLLALLTGAFVALGAGSAAAQTAEPDPVSGFEVTSETVTVENTTETVYADLEANDSASNNTTVTVDLLDDAGTSVADQTIVLEPDSSESVEFDATNSSDGLDLDSGNYTVSINTATEADGGNVDVLDIGTEESTNIPIVSGISDALGVSVSVVVIGGLAVVAFLYTRD